MADSREKMLGWFKEITEALKPLYKGSGLVIGDTSAGYEDRTVPMEGFSRILWGLVPFWMGQETDPELEEIYIKGITEGVDPESENYWGGFRDGDQLFVEMAALSLGLLFTPDKLWTPLSEKTKKQLADWLYQINHYFIHECNWQLFRVLTNCALQNLGEKYDNEESEKSLERLEEYYKGNGWYTDGNDLHRDYYVSFAIHYYSLIYAIIKEKEDPLRSKKYKERAEIFAKDFIYWFADNGEAIPYGRSMTYRFAQCAFWGACVYAGIEPFPVGVMKGIIMNHMEEWMKYPIFDRDHVLTIGYRYPNLHMSESYNSPGSPYWALKAFLVLAFPKDHVFWATKEEPLPELKKIHHVPEAEMIMTRKEGEVCLYPEGTYNENVHNHMNNKYGKFVYSSLFGFSIARSTLAINEAAPDSMLAFEIAGWIFVKRNPIKVEVTDKAVCTTWSPFAGIIVDTVIEPTDTGHIRKHVIQSEIECVVYDCGFAVDVTKEDMVSEVQMGNKAFVKNHFSKCTVSGDNGEGIIVRADANTNLMASKTKIPAIKYGIDKGTTTITTVVETTIV